MNEPDGTRNRNQKRNTDMSTELQNIDDQTTVLPATDPSEEALDRMRRQAQAMQAAHQIGTALAATSMVPQHFQNKPDDAAAAIMYGNELGLPAIQSLQQIFVVRGKPSMFARAMVAIILSKGHRIFEVESSPTSVTWAAVRRDTGDELVATWTIDRATQAGFTSNKLYETQPVEMLRAKAQSEVARNLFPDILLGMSAREDLELQSDPARVRSDVRSTGVDVLRERLGIAPPVPPTDQESDRAAESLTEPEMVDAQASSVDEQQPMREQNRRLIELFEMAGLGKDKAGKAGRRIVVASLLPDRDPASLSAADTEHVIDTLAALAQSSEQSLIDYVEGVIVEHDQQQSSDAPRGDDSGMASRSQVQKLAIVMKEHGHVERDDRLEFLSEWVGRPVGSSAELTAAEASEIIDTLEQARQAEAGQ